MKNTNSPTELVDEITKIYQSIKGPFPYEGCRKVQAEYGKAFDDLVPDLDMFDSTLVGYSSWGEKLLNMRAQDHPQAKNMQYACERSFFELCPRYKMAEQFITADRTPDLYNLLQKLERIRASLTLLLERQNLWVAKIGKE